MKTKPMTEQLVALTQLPKEGFRDYLERAAALYQLLYGEQRPDVNGPALGPRASALPAPSENARPSGALPSGLPASSGKTLASPTPEGVRPRPPMRPPAAGSLRESVYFVLETEQNAASPKRVAELVAAMRSVPVTENLKSSIGEILRNRHDPRIRRISTGLYAIELRNIAE